MWIYSSQRTAARPVSRASDYQFPVVCFVPPSPPYSMTADPAIGRFVDHLVTSACLSRPMCYCICCDDNNSGIKWLSTVPDTSFLQSSEESHFQTFLSRLSVVPVTWPVSLLDTFVAFVTYLLTYLLSHGGIKRRLAFVYRFRFCFPAVSLLCHFSVLQVACMQLLMPSKGD